MTGTMAAPSACMQASPPCPRAGLLTMHLRHPAIILTLHSILPLYDRECVAVQGPGMQGNLLMHPMRPWGTDDIGELPPELCGQPSSTGHGHSPVEGSLTDFETDADYLSILMVRPILLHAIHHRLVSKLCSRIMLEDCSL